MPLPIRAYIDPMMMPLMICSRKIVMSSPSCAEVDAAHHVTREHLLTGSAQDHPPAFQQVAAVGKTEGELNVLLIENDRDPFGVDPADDGDNLMHDAWCQPEERLIHQQETR